MPQSPITKPTQSSSPSPATASPKSATPPSPSPSPSPAQSPSPKSILEALAKMSPEQKKLIANRAEELGLVESKAKDDGNGETLIDGRVRVTIILDVDMGAQLRVWAEAQGQPLTTFISEALTSYVSADWSSAAESQA